MSKSLQLPIFPVPLVLVSSVCAGERPNLITIAWCGVVSSDPLTVSISVRPNRHSHQLISTSGEFVINVPARRHKQMVDRCGLLSGRDLDKLELTGFETEPASVVAAPLLSDFPQNLECRVKQVVALGAHDLFIAEVVAVRMHPSLPDAVDIVAADPLLYIPQTHQYCAVGEVQYSYGQSKQEGH